MTVSATAGHYMNLKVDRKTPRRTSGRSRQAKIAREHIAASVNTRQMAAPACCIPGDYELSTLACHMR